MKYYKRMLLQNIKFNKYKKKKRAYNNEQLSTMWNKWNLGIMLQREKHNKTEDETRLEREQDNIQLWVSTKIDKNNSKSVKFQILSS